MAETSTWGSLCESSSPAPLHLAFPLALKAKVLNSRCCLGALTRPQEFELSRDPAAIATASASRSQFSSEIFCPNMAWTRQGSPIV